jgi:ATP-dependent RNA helicase DDX35
MFPVDIYYSYYPVPDYVKSTVSTIWAIHTDERPGDILAFLTGQEEVERVVSLIKEKEEVLPDSAMKMMVLPMYGGLPASEQLKVFGRTPTDTRKVTKTESWITDKVAVDINCFVGINVVN